MKTIRASLVLAVFSATSVAAQNTPRHPLDGVWSRVGGVSDGRIVTNQPGYRMFVDGHYAWVWVGGMTPRAAAPATGATAAQIREANRLTAEAGRNEITSMQTHVTRGETRVTLNPAGMQPGTFNMFTYRIIGDTLWSANLMSQTGPGAAPQMGRYIRVGSRVSNPLEGAWRYVEGRLPDGTLQNNQPGYRVFVDGHFALVRVNGLAPRPALPPAGTGTAAQVAAAFDPYVAQLGTYEISGQSFTQRYLVTKSPTLMTSGGFVTASFRIRGDSLWVQNIANQDGPIEGAQIGKYVRVRTPPPPTD